MTASVMIQCDQQDCDQYIKMTPLCEENIDLDKTYYRKLRESGWSEKRMQYGFKHYCPECTLKNDPNYKGEK